MPFQLEKVTIHIVQLPLIAPFTTSFGTVQTRDQVLIELEGAGITAWGESAVLPFPFYNHETPVTAQHILKDFAIPLLSQYKPETPANFAEILDRIVGNRIGRSGLEMAYWDWAARAANQPLYKFIGGQRNEIPVGVSLGITETVDQMVEQVGQYLKKGYRKIKVKIAPGFDSKVVEAIFKQYPDCPLMVDANSAYTLDDVGIFKSLDRYNLVMIEQPLREDDLIDHAELQREIKNPICLDESIEHVHDARAAQKLGSCRIINIKPGRVGGITETKKIHDFAQQHGIGVWCGGMLESGIGRATNMAIATLPNYLFPGDISESSRYYHDDIVEPHIELSSNGTLRLLEKPGIGFEVRRDVLKRYTQHSTTIKL